MMVPWGTPMTKEKPKNRWVWGLMVVQIAGEPSWFRELHVARGSYGSSATDGCETAAWFTQKGTAAASR